MAVARRQDKSVEIAMFVFLWAITIDLTAWIIHRQAGWKLQSGPPTALFMISPVIVLFASQRGWFMFKKSRTLVPPNVRESFEKYRAKLSLPNLEIVGISETRVGARLMRDDVEIFDGCFSKLSPAGVEFIVCHEMVHAALRERLQNKTETRTLVLLVSLPLTAMLLALRFDIPIWVMLATFGVSFAILLTIVKFGPKPLWKGYDSEFACDYIAAKMIDNPAAAIEALKALDHGTKSQQKQFGYPAKEARIERIQELMDGKPRRSFSNPNQETAVVEILGLVE